MTHLCRLKRCSVYGGTILAPLFLLVTSTAWAVLGDNAASVLTDQARVRGSLHSIDSRTYVLHEITTPTGAKIREFVSPGGAVFGIAWDGQFPPNFQLLLGAYYQQVQKASAAQKEAARLSGEGDPIRRARNPVVIETSGLVLYEMGHMRSFHGVAYIPQLVPQDVRMSEIH